MDHNIFMKTGFKIIIFIHSENTIHKEDNSS